MLTLAKCARLVGIDNIHIGTVIGKLVGTKEEVLLLEHEMEHKTEPGFKSKLNFLKQNWYNIKPVLAVSSGGLHPGLVPEIINMLGKDCVLQLGGGMHGHPKGTKAGAMALMQAIEASMKKIPLKEYAEKHKELKEALNEWGFTRPV